MPVTEWTTPDKVEDVLKNCVFIKYRPDIMHLVYWCQRTLGEARMCHPLYESLANQYESLPGRWAWTPTEKLWANSPFLFWFADPDDQTAFQLAWSGT